MGKLLTAALLALSTPCFAGQTWVVSPNPCPGVDFADLQTAIDTAADGDTIIVRTSLLDVGAFDISQKSLTLVGDRLVGYVEQPRTLSGVVRDLLPGQSVTIRDLQVSGGLTLVDNLGPIWIEDSLITIPEGTPPQTEVFRIETSTTVALTRCTWMQPVIESLLVDLGGGQDGLVIDRSTVHTFECLGVGAQGVIGDPSSPETMNGQPGGIAVVVIDSTLNDSGSTFSGGDGGSGFAGGTLCASGGDGGAGLYVAGSSSVVRLLDPTVLPGSGGPRDDDSGGAMSCTDGAPGVALDGPGVGQIVTVPGPSRSISFEENGLFREFDGARLVLEGVPGDIVFWGIGLDQAHVYLPSFSGTSVLTALEIIRFGRIPLSGKKKIPFTIGDILSPGEAVTVFTQGYFFDQTLTASVTSPLSAIVVDSSSDFLDGCPGTIFVDDDAPGDPGAGDPTSSDPLEDGTLAHPFDSIQEAVDSAILIGTTVSLADGVYSGLGNADVRPPTGSHLRIESANGPANCVVSATGNLHAFVFEDAGSVRADGLFGVRVTDALFDSAILIKGADVTIDGCIIEGNQALNGAGVLVSLEATPLITNCLIRDNLATNRGGGIYIVGARPEIRNSQLSNNTAQVVGGGLSMGGAEGFNIFNSTIANNIGGGIDLQSTASTATPLLISNCLVWGNTLGEQIRFRFGVIELDYGDVQGGLAGIVTTATGTVNAGPGLIDMDPLFVDPLMSNFHLDAGSPCIDAGDPAYVAAPGETDIDGEARVQGAAVDLGSDERE